MYLVQFIEWMDEIYVEENSRIQMCEEQVKLIVHFSNAIPLQCSDPSVWRLITMTFRLLTTILYQYNKSKKIGLYS